MANETVKASPTRRRFKLSALEMLILVLILVGVVYLISIWVVGSRSSDNAPPSQAPRSLLEKAIVATEKVQAQLASQNKELAAALKKVDQLQKELDAAPKGKGDPRMAIRLKRMEKRLSTIEALPRAKGSGQASNKRLDDIEKKLAELAPPEGHKQLSGRLDRLEKAVSNLEKARGSDALAKRQDQLEKKVAALAAPVPAPELPNGLAQAGPRLARLEKTVAGLALNAGKPGREDKALSGLQKRLDKLETSYSSLAKASPSKPAANSPALESRLDKLEKQLAAAGKAGEPEIAAMRDRLAGVEKRLNQPGTNPADRKIAAVSQRLDQLERKLVQTRLASAINRPIGASSSRFEGRIEELAENLDTLRKDSKSKTQRSSDELDQLRERLEAMELALSKAAKQTGSGGGLPQARLEARLQGLERALRAARERQPAAGRADSRIMARLDELEKKTAELSGKSRTAATRSIPVAKPAKKVAAPPKKQPKLTRIRYKVRRGDTLFAIARRFKVKANDIKEWNPKIKKRRHLWVGEKLTIYKGG